LKKLIWFSQFELFTHNQPTQFISNLNEKQFNVYSYDNKFILIESNGFSIVIEVKVFGES
jgi:hypothetical protein